MYGSSTGTSELASLFQQKYNGATSRELVLRSPEKEDVHVVLYLGKQAISVAIFCCLLCYKVGVDC